MLNLFKRPIEPEIKEDWSKLTLDIVKVALLAIPVVVYGNSPLWVKLLNVSLLLVATYSSLLISRNLKPKKKE